MHQGGRRLAVRSPEKRRERQRARLTRRRRHVSRHGRGRGGARRAPCGARGAVDGVPRRLEPFAKHGVSATFFFTLGPDNMGRHLFRLLKPRFFMKMLRSRAASLYGWDVLFAGTFWSGRKIGAALGGTLRLADEAGHEVGLHAWDHHRWQVSALKMEPRALHDEIARGVGAFTDALGRLPDCSAAAGWVSNERVLETKERFGFRY